MSVEVVPLWSPCLMCDELFCNFHQVHVGQCPCPSPLDISDEFDPMIDHWPDHWADLYGWLEDDDNTEEVTP